MSINYNGYERDQHQGAFDEDSNDTPANPPSKTIPLWICPLTIIYIIVMTILYTSALTALKLEAGKISTIIFLMVLFVLPIVVAIIYDSTIGAKKKKISE